MLNFSNTNVLLCVTGGIAAYKSAEIIRLFKKDGADVRVVMTESSKEFITPLTLQAVSGNEIHDSLLDVKAESAMGHIELYLRNLNIELKWSLDHWWECLRDHFGIIDADSIDLLWLKHNWEFEKRLVRNYNFKASRAVEFSDWLSLYTHNKMDWEKTGYHEQFEEREGEIHHLKVF